MPSTQQLPFRTEPRTVSDQQIDLFNQEQGRKGNRSFRAVDEELCEIEISFKPSTEDIERWLSHPDERVVMSFLKLFLKEMRIGDVTGQRPRDLGPILIKRAEAEGIIWSPLLQELSTSPYWPYKADEEWKNVSEGMESGPQIEKLIPYINQEKDWKNIEALLSFDNARIGNLVLRHSPSIPFARLSEWANMEVKTRELVTNPHLSEPQRSLLFLRAWEFRSAESLETLGKQDFAIRDDIFERIFREPAKKNNTLSDSKTRLQYPFLTYRGLSESQLTEVMSVPGENLYNLSKAVAHPNSNPEIWIRGLKHINDSSDILNALVSNARARQFGPIRSRLLEQGMQGNLNILFAMREEFGEDEATRFIQMAASTPSASEILIYWLENDLPPFISAEMLAPACSSNNQQVRLAAIQALGKLKVPASPQEEAPHKRTR